MRKERTERGEGEAAGSEDEGMPEEELMWMHEDEIENILWERR